MFHQLLKWLMYFSGVISEWSERLMVRQPDTRSSQDSWWVHTGKCIPDRRAPIKMGGSQCHLQHDCDLPHNLSHHDQDKWGCYPMDQRFYSKEKNAAEEWNSKYNSSSWWSDSVSFFTELRCKSSCRNWQKMKEMLVSGISLSNTNATRHRIINTLHVF